MSEKNPQPPRKRRSRFLVAVHAIIAVLIALFVVWVRWLWAAIVNEYGARGPDGGYLRDLNDLTTKLFIFMTGIAIASAVGLMYFWIGLRLAEAIGRALDRRRCRRLRGLCENCGYPIGASPVCTECGAAVPPVQKSAEGVGEQD